MVVVIARTAAHALGIQPDAERNPIAMCSPAIGIQKKTDSTVRQPSMTAYYNEIDPFAAQWLRKLIDVGTSPGRR